MAYGGKCLAGGGLRVACGRWQAAYVGRNHDVGRYSSLNLIFSAATATRSHDASVMVLTIAALDSAGKVDNWILGRADLRLGFSSRICCPLPIDCGRMCAHSVRG